MTVRREGGHSKLAELIVRRAQKATRALLTGQDLPIGAFAEDGVDPKTWERLAAVRSTRVALGAVREALTTVDNVAASYERTLEAENAISQMRWSVKRSFNALDARLSELAESELRAAEIRVTICAALESPKFQRFAQRLAAVADSQRSKSEWWTDAAGVRAAGARSALSRIQRRITEGSPAVSDEEIDWAEFRDNASSVMDEALLTAQALARHADNSWKCAIEELNEALAILTHLRQRT